MSDLRAQRRLAADVLDVGENRVWLDPTAQSEIAEAITREDVRELVREGAIRAEETRGNSRGRARERDAKRAEGHRKGPGTRTGTAGGRQDPKEDWQDRIRAQRRRLRDLKAEGELTAAEYRDLYDMARGGEFEDVRRLQNYIDEHYGDS